MGKATADTTVDVEADIRTAPARAGSRRSPLALVRRLVFLAVSKVGWGVADQGMSSISNFAVNIYIARSLGATEYGAFSLAYVTYGFVLNASRGLATDPLMVRYSRTDVRKWRRAVADCTATAIVTGVVAGLLAIVASMVLGGTAKPAFLALGLTLPGLMLQDSWRFSFFALGRGGHAFLNDTIWAVVLVPTLVVLNKTGHATVFWLVLAWGATAAVAALAGPFQARVVPRLLGVRKWLMATRDLGLRYAAEGTTNAAASQLRNYSTSLILGLAAVGYVQASSTLMGPFMVVFYGMGLVLLPEATRLVDSPKRLRKFCLMVSTALAVVAAAWGVFLLITMPMGLGQFVLKGLWRPTYPLVLPSTLLIICACAQTGAGIGLHALGSAKRSLRAMVLASALVVACAVAGAFLGGAAGTMWGTAIASWASSLLFWRQLNTALREHGGPGKRSRARTKGKPESRPESRPANQPRSRPESQAGSRPGSRSRSQARRGRHRASSRRRAVPALAAAAAARPPVPRQRPVGTAPRAQTPANGNALAVWRTTLPDGWPVAADGTTGPRPALAVGRATAQRQGKIAARRISQRL